MLRNSQSCYVPNNPIHVFEALGLRGNADRLPGDRKVAELHVVREFLAFERARAVADLLQKRALQRRIYHGMLDKTHNLLAGCLGGRCLDKRLTGTHPGVRGTGINQKVVYKHISEQVQYLTTNHLQNVGGLPTPTYLK